MNAPRLVIPQQRLQFLDPHTPGRCIVPSSSTAALGRENGDVDRITSIRREEIQQAVRDLHIADLEAGAGFIVTATCGAHDRQARPDPKAWHKLDPSRDRSQQLYELNQLAVECAVQARTQVADQPAIFGSVITSGDCYDGSRQLRGEASQLERQYREDHRSQLQAFADSHQVDAVLLEAGGASVIELLAICQECHELSLPLLLSLAVSDEGDVLDETWNIPFDELASRARAVLGDLFLGLGLNCNSRPATWNALQKDFQKEFRLVYPNQSNATAEQRRKEQFVSLASYEEEVDFLTQVLDAASHICAVGCCCRDQRSKKLLQAFEEHFKG